MNFLVNALKFSYRRKRYDTSASVVATYRYSIQKPERIENKSFELFHRPRVLRTVFQVVAVGVVAIWTFKNYVDIIHKL